MAKKTASAVSGGRPAPSPPITWPTINAEPGLELERLSQDLIIVDGFFSRQTLKTWRTFLPTINMSPPAPAQKGYAARFNDRFGVQAPDFARNLYEKSGLKELCEAGIESGVKGKRPVGLNPNIRLYKYEEGAYFGPHYDDDFFDPSTRQRSEWTLLIYLTGVEDGVVGGETAFYPSANTKRDGAALSVPLVAGRALLHRHGHACMLHEGRKVGKGTKWVLRSDVMFA
ncbi:hypothetical protein BCR35DRAFT_284257 [Leucosporidium creatinivorum]|uniref:Fe2OG dioxygenase domain-containing protein n=1 Tax=Leucosporidium creatinivorum TaxID=106004 RepID=A0A1Y2DAI6_9BASI|nr:hypothetical protein BCR35DRAFT_284257 [Leucosporidium creatinivorum]